MIDPARSATVGARRKPSRTRLVPVLFWVSASACSDAEPRIRPPAAPPPAEVCNGRDDDHDGTPDEGFSCVAGTTRACVTSCGSTGVEECSAGCSPGPCSPPSEICGNDRDDDCDGVSDSTALLGSAIELAAGSFHHARVIGGPEGYVLARFQWSPDAPPELVLTRFDVTGQRIGDDVSTGFRADVGANDNGISLASGGGVVAVTWAYPPRTGQFLVIRDGAVATPPTAYGTGAVDFTTLPPPIVWTGEQFLVAYAHRLDAWGDLSLQPFGADGRARGERSPIAPDGPYHYSPDVAVAGRVLGVVWDQPSETSSGGFDVYFRSATLEGAPLGEIVRLTDTGDDLLEPMANRKATIAYDGRVFGVAWSRALAEQGAIHFVRLDVDGRTIGTPRRVAGARIRATFPTLVFTGTEYGLAWLDWNSRRTRGQVRFLRLRRDGRPIGTPLVVGETVRHEMPELVWTGHDFGIVFAPLDSGYLARRMLVRVGCE